MDVMQAFQWLVLLIYLGAFLFNAKTFLGIMFRKYNKIPCNKFSTYVEYFAFFLMLQSAFYIGLQIDWIINQHGSGIEGWVDLIWLIYEYIGGLSLLIVAVAIDSLTKLRVNN